MATPPRSWSPSRLKTYSQCGKAYYLDKIKKVPQRQAAWFIHGLTVHDVIEAYEKSFRELSPEEATDFFLLSWDSRVSEAMEAAPDESMWMLSGRRKRETDLSIRRDQGLDQVLSYMRENPPGADLRPTELVPGEPAIEVGFSLDFDGVTVLGYIDSLLEERSTGRLMPEDWKTGAHVPADPYQLATYRHAIERLTGQGVEYGRFWMCRQDKPTLVDLRPYTWEIVTGWYHQLARGIEHDVFLANPGDGCFACTVRPSCSEAA